MREYLALVEGRPPARTGTIDAPLGRDRRVRTRRSIDSDRPREARTHFELEEALPAATLLRVRLETGRTHQIRAHFQAIGHPVCGDREYGSAGRYGLERQFLHAARLELAQPFSGEPLAVDSPLPEDLARALDARPARRLPAVGARRRIMPQTPNPTRTASGVVRPARASARVRTTRRAATASQQKGSSTVAQPGIKELLEAGVHFGHQTRRWNPKMRRFIFGERDGIYIIDLLKTKRLLDQASEFAGHRRPPRRHRPLRRHQEAGARRRCTRSPRRPACPTSTTAGSAAC